jgi:hypothetical protein
MSDTAVPASSSISALCTRTQTKKPPAVLGGNRPAISLGGLIGSCIIYSGRRIRRSAEDTLVTIDDKGPRN